METNRPIIRILRLGSRGRPGAGSTGWLMLGQMGISSSGVTGLDTERTCRGDSFTFCLVQLVRSSCRPSYSSTGEWLDAIYPSVVYLGRAYEFADLIFYFLFLTKQYMSTSVESDKLTVWDISSQSSCSFYKGSWVINRVYDKRR